MGETPLRESVLLEGEQVLLRPIAPADAAEAFALLHGREPILRWLLWDGPRHVRELERFYARWADLQGGSADYRLAVVERSSGAFAGAISLRFATAHAIGDLGYWLGEPFWGRGCGTEAIRLAVHLGFRHLDALSLCAWVFVGNTPSRRALEKNGFQLVRTLPRQVVKDGRRQDEWYLALLREEWEREPERWQPVRDEVRPTAVGTPST